MDTGLSNCRRKVKFCSSNYLVLKKFTLPGNYKTLISESKHFSLNTEINRGMKQKEGRRGKRRREGKRKETAYV